MPESYFEVVSCFGKTIRTTKSHWELITRIKHPEIYGREEDIKTCLSDPLEVRKSSEDEDVFLYYKEGETIWKK
jgi:hypothetical protein